jgi:hypothetical protein
MVLKFLFNDLHWIPRIQSEVLYASVVISGLNEN